MLIQKLKRYALAALVALITPLHAEVTLSISPFAPLSYQFEMDNSGNSVVVWTQSNGTNIVLQSALQPAGGIFFGQALTASPFTLLNFQLEMDQSGNAVVAWQIFDPTTATAFVQVSYKPVTSLFFQTPVTLSTIGFNVSAAPFVAIAGGNIVVTWQITANNGNTVAQGAYMPAGGEWQIPGAPNNPDNIISEIVFNVSAPPQAAVDLFGNAVIVWRIYNQPSNGGLVSIPSNVVQASLKATGALFPTIFPRPGDPRVQDNILSAFGFNVIEAPEVAVGAGNVIVLWRLDNTTNLVLQAANPTF